MNFVELHFPVLGETLPTDHGYPLYAGLSRLGAAIHDKTAPVAIGPIHGQYVGNGQLRLDHRRSRLRLRLPSEQIPAYLNLAGKSINVASHKIRLGVPQVRLLVPAATLFARLVIIKASSPKTNPNDKTSRSPTLTKRYLEPAAFLDGCRQQLDEIGVAGDIGIPLFQQGKHEGQPRRHVLRIKGKRVVGFAVQIEGLTAEESLTVQEQAIGGRRKMGCGFFVPSRKEDFENEI